MGFRLKRSLLPTDKIACGSDGEVDDVVHATSMNSIDQRLPFIALAPMEIDSGKVEGESSLEAGT